MPRNELALGPGDHSPRRRPLRALARPVLYALATGVFLWWILSPLKWWLPRHAGERSSGTTVGCIIPDAPLGAFSG